MAFALRFGSRDYPLSEGRFVIGRSESCQLCLDDPLASRNHAAIVVEGEELRLEDLDSRNGVTLNKHRVTVPERLVHGDTIRIGSQDMTIVQRRTGRAETLAQSPSVKAEAFGVLGGLAEKAIAMGRGDEAERILGRQLDQILERAEAGERLDAELLQKTSTYAFRIALLTRRGKWLDFLLRLYTSSATLMDGDLVNELYALGPSATNTSRGHLRTYLSALSPKASAFGPSERFVLSRLEGLERQL